MDGLSLLNATQVDVFPALTRKNIPIAVGFTAALLTTGHGQHLLGRGAAHLLTRFPPHPRTSQADLEERRDGERLVR